MIDKASAAMIGGGGIGAVTANTEKVQQSVNLLYYRIWDNGEIFVTPSTVISFIGCIVALYGLYRALKKK